MSRSHFSCDVAWAYSRLQRPSPMPVALASASRRTCPLPRDLKQCWTQQPSRSFQQQISAYFIVLRYAITCEADSRCE